jgi:hypothetical protein
MNEKAMKIKQPKRRGEWVELRFMAAAAENDMNVTRPWGDSAQYDFIVEHQARFLRIQVKSTQFFDRGCYPCAVKGSHWLYAENAFDFLAVYILPEDLWYIIPAHAFRGQSSVALRPAVDDSKYAEYLGAWELMKQALEIPTELEEAAPVSNAPVMEPARDPSLD